MPQCMPNKMVYQLFDLLIDASTTECWLIVFCVEYLVETLTTRHNHVCRGLFLGAFGVIIKKCLHSTGSFGG